MGLVEIKTFEELMRFMPLIIRTYKDLDGLWEGGTDLADFLQLLTDNFNTPGSHYYGIKVDDKLFYFVVILPCELHIATFWLFYVNKDKRAYTKSLLDTIRAECKRNGYKHLNFTTVRMTRSFDRWVTKLGAVKHSLTYKLPL